MATMTLAEIDAELALVNTRISALLASPNPDVSINGRSVSAASYLAQLRQHREGLLVLRAQLFPTDGYTVAIPG